MSSAVARVLASICWGAALAGCAAEHSVLFVGDTSFGENYQSDRIQRGRPNILHQRGYDWFLGGVDPLLRSADVVVANLETPLCDYLIASPLERAQPWKLLHYSDPRQAAAALARHRITVVGLGNNHAMDYGPQGFRQSVEALGRNAIAFYGAGSDLAGAERPWVHRFVVGGREMGMAVFGGYEEFDRYRDIYHFYAGQRTPGVASIDPARLLPRIAAWRRDHPNDFIIVTPHWKFNYMFRVRGQERQSRAMIDAGADLVVGHGAHMAQAFERFRGRWILYSLGNFIFNADNQYRLRGVHPYSLTARLTFAAGDGRIRRTLRLYPINTSNVETDWRPRPLTEAEFAELSETLRARGPDPELHDRAVRPGRDGIGRFLEIDLEIGAGETRGGLLPAPAAPTQPAALENSPAAD